MTRIDPSSGARLSKVSGRWTARRTAAAVLGATGLLLSLACTRGPEEDRTQRTGPAPPVEAVPARTGSLPLEEELGGIVRARNQVAIRPEISASVVKVAVRNGDSVAAGQELVRLDDRVLGEQLRRAQADLRVAEANASEARARAEEVRARVVRTRALADSGLTSTLDLETLEAQLDAVEAGAVQAEAGVEQARATVAERRSALAKTVVTAPVAGRVGQRDVEVGMLVGPSSTLFLIGDFDELIVEAPLTQEMLRQVREGTPVEIEARGASGPPLRASISRISPFLEAVSFSTTAEIDVTGDAGGLRPGMFVTVRVLYGESEPATLVPASALWEEPLTGDATVFVIEDAAGLSESTTPGGEVPAEPRTATRRRVQVLAVGRGLVGVRGVDAGEWVVTLGQHLLQQSLEESGGESVPARVRPTSWPQVLALQSLQREDLLERFLAKQRAVARALGAKLPESTAEVDEALRATATGPSPAAAQTTAAGRSER